MKKRWIATLLSACAAVSLCGCGQTQEVLQESETVQSAQDETEVQSMADTKDAEEIKTASELEVNYDGIATGKINAGVSVHDPSIIKANGQYYIYGSHMSGAVSTDLRIWENIANGYAQNNPVYGNLFAEGLGVFDYAGNKDSLIPTDDGTTHVWAPDIIYNEAQGLYYLYYCTTSTWNASNLCYGVSENVDGPFEWKGALIYSGFTKDTIEATDVYDYVSEEYAAEKYMKADGSYNFNSYPNAIDPSVFYDEDGRLWMVYGSWSGGIFLIELNEETGEVIHPEADEENRVDPYYGKRLLGGNHKSIEGPYILYDAESGYYYLFLSYGSLVREGGYQIRVFRSETVDGDYVDMKGEYPLAFDNHPLFGLKLSGNYFLPSLKYAYMATGHNSAFIDDDGKKYICYHTRFDQGTEYHEPRVKQFLINEEGWPCMLPYATDGETVSETGYGREKVAGEYYLINQGLSVDARIAEPIKVILQEDGTVTGNKLQGSWEMAEGTYYMRLTYNDKDYSGVFCEMKDEAGTKVMTFSAVGDNQSVWGVKY